ncbi:recombinase family protein [Arthrobacter sp. OAP107]|uniref:recombinase family protein n=1 Tax=Arthrobacter sp. OAP107 TaxID=3156445 RepID=UPI0033929EBB
MDPKNLLIREYLRVSKDRSGRGKSPDQQHDENAAALAQRGWDIHPRPYRDNYRSASRYSKQAREGFAQLMSDLEEDAFGAGALGLWESGRGSRRTGEWVDLIEPCEERGIRIWVTTPGGSMTRPTPAVAELCWKTPSTLNTRAPRRANACNVTCAPTPRRAGRTARKYTLPTHQGF